MSAGLFAGAAEPDAAREFTGFLATPEAVRVMAARGLGRP
jgi:ABC-type Fe3+ transport system substrate-binding protein